VERAWQRLAVEREAVPALLRSAAGPAQRAKEQPAGAPPLAQAVEQPRSETVE
jgi:hypothetical protein